MNDASESYWANGVFLRHDRAEIQKRRLDPGSEGACGTEDEVSNPWLTDRFSVAPPGLDTGRY